MLSPECSGISICVHPLLSAQGGSASGWKINRTAQSGSKKLFFWNKPRWIFRVKLWDGKQVVFQTTFLPRGPSDTMLPESCGRGLRFGGFIVNTIVQELRVGVKGRYGDKLGIKNRLSQSAFLTCKLLLKINLVVFVTSKIIHGICLFFFILIIIFILIFFIVFQSRSSCINFKFTFSRFFLFC